MADETNIIASVGNTPLVQLTRVVPAGFGRVLVKVESQNSTGSMKDRMALSVVDRAAASGRLEPSGTLVEYTGGSTGTSLAFVCAARGVSITLVTSDAFSQEKRDHMRALGANVIEIASDGGGTTKQLIQSMMAKAEEIGSAPRVFGGTSSGANVVGALRVAERLGSDATVVTLLCDSGLKYLSTDLYKQG